MCASSTVVPFCGPDNCQVQNGDTIVWALFVQHILHRCLDHTPLRGPLGCNNECVPTVECGWSRLDAGESRMKRKHMQAGDASCCQPQRAQCAQYLTYSSSRAVSTMFTIQLCVYMLFRLPNFKLKTPGQSVAATLGTAATTHQAIPQIAIATPRPRWRVNTSWNKSTPNPMMHTVLM